MVPERMENAVLEEGMLTSDEPGIYIEGSHGIRTENLMLCRKAEKNMYGQFMRFEFVTMVPDRPRRYRYAVYDGERCRAAE